MNSLPIFVRGPPWTTGRIWRNSRKNETLLHPNTIFLLIVSLLHLSTISILIMPQKEMASN